MITITKMLPEHRSILFEMLQQTDMFTVAEIDVAMELIDTFLFNKEQKDYDVYVALSKKTGVAGYVCYGPTPAAEGTFDLYWIVVSPAVQRMGIGRQLLHFVERSLINMGARLLIIETSSQPKYDPTVQFYLNNSYELAARIKDFYRPGDDRLILTKYFSNVEEGAQ
ncbi:GNAT family N-acetyltransferase [bacterium]|nr:GNAT family N-acetyltransferase [bacterium]